MTEDLNEDNGDPNEDGRVSDGESAAAAREGSSPEGDRVEVSREADAVTDLRKENEFLVDQLQRSRAELANFRRRMTEERLAQERRLVASVFRQVIPLIDDLQLALGTPENERADAQSLRAGLEMIVDKFSALLAEFDIEPIPAVGESFDPNWHEAMLQQEAADIPEGQIIEEFVRGYRLGEDLVRAARVIVAKAPATED